jgi:spoIIIJ-associated protein
VSSNVDETPVKAPEETPAAIESGREEDVVETSAESTDTVEVSTEASSAENDSPKKKRPRRRKNGDGKKADAPAPVDDGPFVEDGRADMALDFLVELLTTMGMDCTVDLMENNESDPPSDIRIEVTGSDAGRLVGKKGQTLQALQFLANRVTNRPSKPRRHILIDSDGYRARREGALSSMAQKLGEQAVAEGKIITFEPMSAQDRRVVHLALAKSPGLVTKSEGKGASRRVQIIPVREDQ